jgi:hypothetical protein
MCIFEHLLYHVYILFPFRGFPQSEEYSFSRFQLEIIKPSKKRGTIICMWWHTLVIPATQAAEAGGLQVGGQTGQFSETLSQNKRAGN